MNEVLASPQTNKRQGPRLSVGGMDQLADALRAGQYGAFEAKSPIAATLFPLLKALDWRGNLRELFEAMPHFANSLSTEDLRNILATLGYTTHQRMVKNIDELDERLLPCVVITSDNKPYVLFGKKEVGYAAFGGEEADKVLLLPPKTPSTVLLISKKHEDQESKKAKLQESWFGNVVRRFKPIIGRLFVVTFFINMLALAVPLSVMAIYDQVIPLKATDVLVGLSVGVGIILFFDVVLRLLRVRLIAFMGARIEHIVGTAVFAKILNLPPSMTEAAPLGDQVAKIRDFDSLRDVFSSLIASVVLDLPFVVLFLIVLSSFAGVLAFIPILMIVLYVVIWAVLAPPLRRSVKVASRMKAERHSFLVEAITNMRTVKEAAVEEVWAKRYRELSATAAISHHTSAQYSFMFQTLGQTVMMGSGLATLAYGVDLAISGEISMGGLIAAMAITWRILSPIQNLFLTFARVEQTKIAINQIDSLMKLKEEKASNKQASGVERAWLGGLSLSRVSLRYNANSEPALLGVNLQITAGEFVAITGANGSGKSSVLRILLGLHSPQAGQIRLDGVDIRQIAPRELRNTMAYVPQRPSLFHGTIAQNLRLGNPIASDEDITRACQYAGVLEDIEALKDGLQTRVGDQNIWQMNSGLRQRLALARAYVADTPILLMDEPAHALDDKGDRALMTALEELRGTKTIIMVSHRPSHLRLADTLIQFERGRIIESGTPDKILGIDKFAKPKGS